MAVAEATAGAVLPVSARAVGNAFVRQYYRIQHQRPELVHRFYLDISKLGRPEDNGTMSITTTMQDINKKILSLNYGENRAEIKSVDAQESYNGGVHVLVTGYLMGKDNMIRNFTQTFFLAPQEKGYFVLNDILRYVEDINHINREEALNPRDSWEVSSMEEEVPVAEVVDESPDDSQIVVESNSKIEEVLKKSYASIVMDTKESAVPLSSPAPTSQRSVAKGQEQQVNLDQASASVVEEPVSGPDAIETGNNHEGEGFTHSNGGRHAFVEEKRSTNSRVNMRRFSTLRGYGFRNDGARGRANYGNGRGYTRGDFNGRDRVW